MSSTVNIESGEVAVSLSVRSRRGHPAGAAGDAHLERAIRGRTAAERKLVENAQRERILMDLIGHIPFETDRSGSIVSIGRSWHDLTGQERRSALHQGWTLCLHADDIVEVLARWREAIVLGKRLEVDFRIQESCSLSRWLRLRAAPTLDHTKEIIGWYGTFEDVDDSYRARVEHDQMQSALIQLSRVSAMGTMASTLAHELNQPLTALSAFIRSARRFLEAKRSDSEVCDALVSADGAAMRAGEIVRRVRELVGSGQVDKRPEDLASVVSQACELILNDGKSAGLDLTLDITANLGFVLIDRIQIQQVLLNLIRNSVEALQGRDDRRILIRVYPCEDDHCAVSVRDTGAGIPPEVVARLFESFNTSKVAGSGIGLSICRTIVEAHGGHIWHVPHEDGTEMNFTLPCDT